MYEKNIIKLLIILFISISIPTASISQTISTDIGKTMTLTPQQLKTTNLIFAEHEKWSKEIPLLNTQIKSYKELVNSYVVEDSLKSEQIDFYKLQIKDDKININKLNKRLKVVKVAGISSSILLFLLGVFITK